MKKAIIIGICITTLLFVLTPTIPAQQYTQVKAAYEQNLQEKFDSLLESFEKFDVTDETQKNHKEKLINVFSSLKDNIEVKDPGAEPTFLRFLLSTILSLIFSLIGTIFGVIFGPLLSFLVQILTAPAVLLAKIIAFLFGGSEINI